jgi:predicted enzyme related to lactoylglutathione lyase
MEHSGIAMTGPARAGLFIYAKDLDRVAGFYEALLGMSRLHGSAELVVLQSQDVQLVVHQIPASIAAVTSIASPPQPRGDCALKFFFSVPSIDIARGIAPGLGGQVLDPLYPGRGFIACNAIDPEGNLFHLREYAA